MPKQTACGTWADAMRQRVLGVAAKGGNSLLGLDQRQDDFLEIGQLDDADASPWIEHEQIGIAGDDGTRATGQSQFKKFIVVGIPAVANFFPQGRIGKHHGSFAPSPQQRLASPSGHVAIQLGPHEHIGQFVISRHGKNERELARKHGADGQVGPAPRQQCGADKDVGVEDDHRSAGIFGGEQAIQLSSGETALARLGLELVHGSRDLAVLRGN